MRTFLPVVACLCLLPASKSVAGIFDKLEVVSKEKAEKLEDENKKLRAEVQELKKKLEQGPPPTRLPQGDYTVLLGFSELSDGDGEDYLKAEAGCTWYALVDLRASRTITRIDLLVESRLPNGLLTAYGYDEPEEKWVLLDDIPALSRQVTLALRAPYRTDRLKLVPAGNVRSLHDLRVLEVGLVGY